MSFLTYETPPNFLSKFGGGGVAKEGSENVHGIASALLLWMASL